MTQLKPFVWMFLLLFGAYLGHIQDPGYRVCAHTHSYKKG